MKIKLNTDKGWQIIAHLVMIIAASLALIPFLLLIIASFTDNTWATANGFSFFPKKWSMLAYQYIANQWETIGRAYMMTIFVTAIGTALSIIITSMLAYALADENTPGIRLLNFLVIFTMLFSGGIVASYYCWVKIFNIRNTIWALILPGLLMNAFNVTLVKNYYKFCIPVSLLEAARIDGAGELKIFRRVMLPLALPITATIGLMNGLMYWNDWTNGLYYLTERGGSKFYTVQIILNTINQSISFLANNLTESASLDVSNLPTTTVRMAIAVVGFLPVLVIYPFFQKYFVKGITLGGVKG